MGGIIKNVFKLGVGAAVVSVFVFAVMGFFSPRGALIFSVVSGGLGAVLFFGVLQPRIPMWKKTGILLVWAGVLGGNGAKEGFELAALQEKIPEVERMSLREQVTLFERLVELDRLNQDYRERRDQLSETLKTQEAEERAEKERVRLAAEEEQRKMAREEECAKLPRDPNAWEKAVLEGTLSPRRGQAKLYVQKQVACYPGDGKLAKQLAYMQTEEGRVAREEDAFRNPQNYLKLKTTWRTAADGIVMKADFRIQNTSTISIRDIAVVCNLKAPSGTVVSVNRQTIYDVVKGGATRAFENVNMGFTDPQASNASCRVEAAKAP